MNSNLYKDREYAYRLSKVVALFIRGPDCFDFSLYRSKNLDLAALSDNDALWEEFVMHGQFVGRVFRCVSCVCQLSKLHKVTSRIMLICLISFKSHDIETFPPIAILKTPQARHRPCLILNIKRDLHHAHYRFTCANPLDDGNNAKSLLKMAKATLQQLMHEAFAKDT